MWSTLGSEPVHSGQHSVAVEGDAESEHAEEEGVKPPRTSGRGSVPRNGSKVPQIKVKLNDEDNEYNEEGAEEKAPIKKSIHIKLE